VWGAQFSRAESRVLTSSDDTTARLWDVAKPEPLQIFKHDNHVNGAQFSHDESRVLTWSDDQAARLWDCSDALAMLTPAERLLELKVRSGTTLDEQQNLQTLKCKEWIDLATSPEYQAIEQKLAARSAKPAPQAPAANRQPTVETPGSSSKR
jgi:WD40 repeat protein